MGITDTFIWTPREDVGSDLRQELEDTLASIKVRAQERAQVVEARLKALEAEQADLRQVERQAAAAQVA